MKKIMGILIAAFLLPCCTTTVNLVVKNSYEKPLAAIIQVMNNDGIKEEQISLGDIKPNDEIHNSFKIKHDYSFSVTGALQQSATIYRSASITVPSKPDPLDKTITMENQCRWLDNSKSLQALSNSFQNLGPNIGAQPTSLAAALSTKIGSLAIAELEDTTKPASIIFSVPPTILGVKVLTLSDIRFPDVFQNQKVDISGTYLLTTSASIGPIAKFGFQFKDSDIYNLDWTLRGYGTIDKEEEHGKDCITCYYRLPQHIKDAIVNTLKVHPKAKLYYINKFYVLKSANMAIKTAKKLEINADLNVNNIVNGGSAYSFDNTTVNASSYSDVVLNYWGDELCLSEKYVNLPNTGNTESTNKKPAKKTKTEIDAKYENASVKAKKEFSIKDVDQTGFEVKSQATEKIIAIEYVKGNKQLLDIK